MMVTLILNGVESIVHETNLFFMPLVLKEWKSFNNGVINGWYTLKNPIWIDSLSVK